MCDSDTMAHLQPIATPGKPTMTDIEAVARRAARKIATYLKAEILDDGVEAVAAIITTELSSLPSAVLRERQRCAVIAEAVNDSMKAVGKFTAHILNPNTCIVPLDNGLSRLSPEHVFDNAGLCVYCAESKDVPPLPNEREAELKELREYYDAHQAVENEVVNFDLHHARHADLVATPARLNTKLLNEKLADASFSEQEMRVIQILISQCLEAAPAPSASEKETAREIVESLSRRGKAYVTVNPNTLAHRITSALATNKEALIDRVKAKRDEWQAIADSCAPNNQEQVRQLDRVEVCNEIITALESLREGTTK